MAITLVFGGAIAIAILGPGSQNSKALERIESVNDVFEHGSPSGKIVVADSAREMGFSGVAGFEIEQPRSVELEPLNPIPRGISSGDGNPGPRGGDGEPSTLDIPFSADTLVYSNTANQRNPTMDIDENGALYVAFTNETSPGNLDVYVAVSTDGGTSWSIYPVATDGTYNEFNPSIAVQSSTNILIFYQHDRDNALDYARSTDGGQTWTVNSLTLPADIVTPSNISVDATSSWFYAVIQVWDEPNAGGHWCPLTIRSADANLDPWSGIWWIFSDTNITNPTVSLGQTYAHIGVSWDIAPGYYDLLWTRQDTSSALNDVDSWDGWTYTSYFSNDIVYPRSSADGPYLYYVWQFSSDTDDSVLALSSYDDGDSFLFSGVAFELTEEKKPSVFARGSFAYVVYLNDTVNVTFKYTWDVGYSWSREYKVTSLDPGTAFDGIHAADVVFDEAVDKPRIVWHDNRGGDEDIYYNTFGPYVTYVITKSPSNIDLLNAGVTVNGTTWPAPVSFIWPIGSEHNISVELMTMSGTDTRFIFSNWSDGGAREHNITVGGNDTVLIANYLTQYYLTMTATYGTVTPGSGWYDEGTVITINSTPPTPAPGERYVWLFWMGSGLGSYTGPGNNPPADVSAQITMLSPITEEARWRKEYYLTVVSPYGTTSGEGWYEENTTAVFSVTTPVSAGAGVQYAFSHWSGEGVGSYDGPDNPGSVIMRGPITETAVWGTQYYLNITATFGTTNPVSGWYWAGEQVTISAIPPPINQTGERYNWTGWTGSSSCGDEYVGMDNPATIVMNCPIDQTANWVHEFYLSIGASHGTTDPLSGWRPEGDMFQIQAIPPANGTGERYVWVRWTGSGNGSYDGSFQTPTITMNGPICEYAEWRHQYYLTLLSDHGVTSGEGWYDEGSTAIFSVSTPVYDGSDTRYVFSNWTGTGLGSYSGPSNPSSVVMNGPITETTNWITEFLINFTTTPVDLNLVLDSVVYQAPVSMWWANGSSHSIAAPTPQQFATTRYQFESWSDGGARLHTVTVTGPETLTASYATEFAVTVKADPVGRTFQVNGVNYAVETVFWWPEGSQQNLTAITPQSVAADTRYVFDYWSDGGPPSHNITVEGANTYVVYYALEYRVTVKSVPSSAVIRIDGTDYTGSNVFWWRDGSIHHLDAITPQVSGSQRLVFDNWDDGGPSSRWVTIVSPSSYVANFIAQVEVIVDTVPSGLSVEVDSVIYLSPVSFWWDTGSLHTINTPSPQVVDEGIRYTWLSWSDSGPKYHTITANAPGTITASFEREYFVTFEATYPGINLTIDSVSYPAPVSFWWGEWSLHTINATSPQAGGEGTRYVWISWSDGGGQEHLLNVSGPATYTATYGKEFETIIETVPAGLLVEVDSVTYQGPVTFWWSEGSIHQISAPSPQDVAEGSRHEWRSWSDGLERSHVVRATGPMNFTAYFVLQYKVVVEAEDSAGDSISITLYLDGATDPTGTTPYETWLDTNSSHSIRAEDPVTLAETQYSLQYWTVDGDFAVTPILTLVVESPTTVVAMYDYSTGTIVGTVYDAKSSTPVFGATVTADDGTTTTTDSTGSFELILPEGQYQITVTVSGYLDQTESVSVDAGETVLLSFFMIPEEDQDLDGLPDSWEVDYFGDTSAEPTEDPDQDGFSNLEEYEAGTDPNVPANFLKHLWWIWLILMLVFVIATIVFGVVARRRRPPKEIYEEVVPAEEEVVEEEAVRPPPPEEEPEEVEEAAPEEAPPEEEEAPPEEVEETPPEEQAAVEEAGPPVEMMECPNCGLLAEVGTTECPICGAAFAPESLQLTKEERIAKLDEALKEGKITIEQYQINLKKILGG